MTLRLYNTLSRKKEDFVPLDPSNVRMYVCGPTVYDYAHIGNARPVIVFDVLFRLLQHLAKEGVWDGGKGETKVKYVRNITDVDDKINQRAREEGVSIRELTERTYSQFAKDIAALGVLPPTVEPRATEHIAEMIAIIQRLIDKGHAYAADGHVLFDVPSMKDYGELSRRSLDEMMAGARVDVAPYKRGEMDFVLWKPSDAETPGWDSPWGRGRPGWHIECSAMSWKHLGEVFDIHGGGIDLVFPHHENEIAQTRCAFGHRVMANIWMHNGFLQVESQKMSKSLGNFRTIRELLDSVPGDVLRLQMMMTHYRQPIDWTWANEELAREELYEWANVLENTGIFRLQPVAPNREVILALEDDLNTPAALSKLRKVATAAKLGGTSEKREFASTLRFLGFKHIYFPGLFQGFIDSMNLERAAISIYADDIKRLRAAFANDDSQAVIDSLKSKLAHQGIEVAIGEGHRLVLKGQQKGFEENIVELINARLEARKAKNWAESDRIRDELAAMGIAIKDNKDGTTSWEVKR